MSKLQQLWQTAIARDGGFLTNRAIRFLGHLIAMAVIMKLTWMGGLSETYFTIYCAFIAGDASLAQVLKTKAPAPDETKSGA